MSAVGRPRSASAAFGVALSVFAVWTLATYLLEGAHHTLLRPEATTLRALYMLVANYGIGIVAAIAAIRWARLAGTDCGLGSARRALIAVAGGSALGVTAYLTIGGPTTNPVALTNVYAQVLGVSIAEVVVCWALVGASAAAVLRSQRRVVALAAGIVVSSVSFGLYHFAHSPPFNTIELVAKLTLVGVATSAFFFASRDVYGRSAP